MIGHIFRLIWNRRRANALILIEVTICFLVLCALTLFLLVHLVMVGLTGFRRQMRAITLGGSR